MAIEIVQVVALRVEAQCAQEARVIARDRGLHGGLSELTLLVVVHVIGDLRPWIRAGPHAHRDRLLLARPDSHAEGDAQLASELRVARGGPLDEAV